MLISLRHRFIFLHIPKNAGTAIRYAINSVVPSDTAHSWGDQFYSVTKNPQALHFRSGLKILPYHMNQQDLQPFLDHIGQRVDNFFEFAVVRHPYARVSSLACFSERFSNRVTHNKPVLTIDQVLDRIEEKHDNFYASQMSWIDHPATKKVHVYHYENLENEWLDICSQLKLNLPAIPRLNVNPIPHTPLTSKQKERCYSLLEREFTELGYER